MLFKNIKMLMILKIILIQVEIKKMNIKKGEVINLMNLSNYQENN